MTDSLKSLLLAAGVTVALASALGTHASAGTLVKKASGTFLEGTMGLRVVETAAPKDGPKSVEAQVVNAARFASRGYPDAKVNDRVTIVILNDKHGTVKHQKSGKARNFKLTDDGKIEEE